MNILSTSVKYFFNYVAPFQTLPKGKMISALVTGILAYGGLTSLSKKLQHYLIDKKIELPPTKLEIEEVEKMSRPKSFLGRSLALSLVFLCVVHIPLSPPRITSQAQPTQSYDLVRSIFEFAASHPQPLIIAINSDNRPNLARSARYYLHMVGTAMVFHAIHELSDDARCVSLAHLAYNACTLIDLFVFKSTIISR